MSEDILKIKVYVRDTRFGIWHEAKNTYPSTADSVCGQHVLADFFVATSRGQAGIEDESGEMRATMCPKCKEKACED